MDPAAFDTLVRSFSVPGTRRRMLQGMAAVLGVGLAGASHDRTHAEKLAPCRFTYYTAEGRRIRGYGYADFPSTCAQCQTSRDCDATDFPLCLTDYTSLTSGASWNFARSCGTYTKGVCGLVHACAPDQAQQGMNK